jgi:adenine-specific DNA-methyltransferase
LWQTQKIMSDKKFKTTLESLLKKDSRLIDENKELNLALLRELVDKIDEKLIELLLGNEEVRAKFFIKIKDVFVFKQSDFKFFLDANKIDNSYTAYENKIGLSTKSRLLKDTGNVVLNFPYKDCVLEGGQSTEEGMDEYYEYNPAITDYELYQAQRKEIFFNEVLAHDEIDRLFEPKAFYNIKKYTSKGEEGIKEFTRDKNGTIADNLIIKGNNLLVLQSLKKQYNGLVSTIYIDPPYNTSKDEFKYNDHFNHSSWLTFMRNRLEVANDLLNNSGAIVISCDDHEQAYLEVLMDEIFGSHNFLLCGAVNRASEIASNFSISKHEYFLIYAKDIGQFKLKGGEKYTFSRGTVGNPDQTMPVITFPAGLDCRGVKDGEYKTTRQIVGSSENIENLDTIIVKDGKLLKPVRLKAKWRSSNDMRNFFNNDCKPTIAKINGIIEEIYFEGDRFMPQIKKKIIEKIPSLILDNKRGSKDLEDLGFAGQFKYPKSVEFLKQLLSYLASKEDIVLDFFAGSGTTAQAILELNEADKGNRKFILVEQMSYAETLTSKRVHAVIKENKKSSFIYLELAKFNEGVKAQIAECKSLKDLEKLLSELSDKYFLDYNVKFKEFEEKIIKESAFIALPLGKQKELFLKMLDLNQLYVNASEMDDKKYGLSKEDIALTKNFYNL